MLETASRRDNTDLVEARERVLLADAQLGERGAIGELFALYAARIDGTCRLICSSAEDAMDAAQEARIDILRGLTKFQGRSKLSTWVHVVTTRAAIRVSKKRSRIQSREPNIDETTVKPPEIHFHDGDPVTSERIRLALDRLRPEVRRIVVLRDYLDVSYSDIALELDMTESHVRVTLTRAHKALRALLGGQCDV